MKKPLLIAITSIVVVALLGVLLYFTTRDKNVDKVETVTETTQEEKTEPTVDLENLHKKHLTPVNQDSIREDVEFETSIYRIIFDTKGASVKSIILKDYSENGEELDLLLKSKDSDRAFLLYEGRSVFVNPTPINDVFDYKVEDGNVIFEKDFYVDEDPNNVVKIRKTFRIGDSEYMFAIKVDMIPVSGSNVNFNGYAYSLGFEPQLGPSFLQSTSRQARQNTRTFYLKFENKKKPRSLGFSGGIFTYEDPFQWLELTGKYFSYIIAPQQSSNFHISASQKGSEKERNLESRSFLVRKAENGNISDVFNIYLGPQLKNKMNVFNRAQDNSFGVQNLYFERGLEAGGSLVWLQTILKWIMTFFYKLIPNWGISIILLTILIKLLLFPLQQKSMNSSAKMGELTPRINEIKERYKDDPQKMNEATLSLYKEADIHPFLSFIPLLIQFPILLAMYGLLNKHFELRGAMFIPGWITDLSSPETLFNFPFSIPFMGTEFHLMPIIYLATMIFLMVYTQKSSTAGQSNAMQKFMTYGFPIIFFFMLYNTSSGLLLYWTMSNVFSIVQQLITNIVTKKKKRAKAEEKIREDKENKPTLYTGVLPPKAKKKERK